ncbi:MAG TPA: M20/M25/M40 family metallo-hydrolase [Rhizomicrobium sp.]|nr:M20/M25/M40 family metallo-hydrolase [Rhizomicrobium sp.]
MESRNIGGIVRIVVLALVAVAIWWAAKYGQSVPTPLPANAAATAFSAAHAEVVLARLLGPERPHPASSAENTAVRARLLTELAALGVKATTYRGVGCDQAPRYGIVECGTVTDVIGDVVPGDGKAIVLMAHYDSVPAGPGAADDESGVATVLETIRALKARGGQSKHPIIAVLTDGEEYGLLGAASFLDNPALKARVGAVINVEARGNQGQSLLFQTSPGDGKLIDLYARSVSHYATSSLYAVIYKFLPNDTDLTLFIRDGFLSFNFAFTGNVADYHTPLDRRANLSTTTLQQHGDNMLGVASSLEQTDFASLKGGDDVYMAVMGAWLPRMPAAWALPLSIAVLVLLALVAFFSRGEGARGWAAAFGMPLALIAGCGAIGWVLHTIAAMISGEGDPSFAYPTALRIALAFGCAGVAVSCARVLSPRMAALGAWLWYAVLGVITAAFLTGLSPYFLFPAVIAAVILLAVSRLDWRAPVGQAALFVASLGALVVWLGFAASGETVAGLALHPLFTIPVAFGVMTLLPLVGARQMSRNAWLASVGVLFAVALGSAIVAGLQPAYSAIAPLRLNVNYVEDHDTGRAVFAADANAKLPSAMRRAAVFSASPQRPYPFARGDAYVAQAGAPRFAAPTAAVTITPLPGGRRIALAIRGSADTGQMAIVIPKAAKLMAVTIDGKHIDAPKEWAGLDNVVLLCTTRDCRNAAVTLDSAATSAFDVTLGERRFGVPDFGQKIVTARPNTAVQSQLGDGTVILAKVRVGK